MSSRDTAASKTADVRTLCLVLLLGASAQVGAQTPGPTARGEVASPVHVAQGQRSWLLLPNVFYAPETGVGGGVVVGLYSSSSLTQRVSSTILDLTVTSHRQISLELQPELYVRNETARIEGRLKVMFYPDVFYGVGPDAAADSEEEFTSRALDLRLHAQLRVGESLWLGPRLIAYGDDIVRTEEDGVLHDGTVPGSGGGVSAGLGVVATLDTRDNRFNALSGSFAEAHWTGYTSSVGDASSFNLASVDLRHYFQLGASTALAVRGLAHVSGGTAPFQLLPRLGGPRLLRGYRDGRFRDNAAVAVEAECRFPIFSRIGGVVFAGAGDVAPGVTGLPAIADMERSAGVGLRYRMNAAGVRIRIDWAAGRDGSALYIGVGEAM
jgi:hypothetical protein